MLPPPDDRVTSLSRLHVACRRRTDAAGDGTLGAAHERNLLTRPRDPGSLSSASGARIGVDGPRGSKGRIDETRHRIRTGEHDDLLASLPPPPPLSPRARRLLRRSRRRGARCGLTVALDLDERRGW